MGSPYMIDLEISRAVYAYAPEGRPLAVHYYHPDPRYTPADDAEIVMALGDLFDGQWELGPWRRTCEDREYVATVVPVSP